MDSLILRIQDKPPCYVRQWVYVVWYMFPPYLYLMSRGSSSIYSLCVLALPLHNTCLQVSLTSYKGVR